MTNPLQVVTTYIKESREELNKVTWPTRSQTKNYTILVIALSVAVAVFFSVLDVVFDYGINFLSGCNQF